MADFILFLVELVGKWDIDATVARMYELQMQVQLDRMLIHCIVIFI